MAESTPNAPRYYQIAQVLRGRVESPDFGAEGRLPTEQALCSEFGVSRTTVRHALDTLKREGLLRSRPGVGTRRVGVEPRKIVRSSGDPLHAELPTRRRVVAVGMTAAPTAVAAFLGVAPGARVLRVVRGHELEGEPLSVVVSYLPERFAPALTRRALRGAMHDLLWQHFGIRLHRSVHTVRIVRADGEIARLLGVGLAEPVLKVQSSVYTEDGTPIRWTENFFRENRYEYVAEMEWPAPASAAPAAARIPARPRGRGAGTRRR